VVFGVLDEVVEGVFVFLHEPEDINVHAAVLAHRSRRVVILLVHVLLIGGRVEQRHVHVVVICELDGAHELHQLLAEVVHALRGHHEVVLHRDRETLAHGVAGEGALALGEHAGGGLVRDAAGHALVERVHVPLDLLVGLVHVHVGKDVFGEGGGGCVCDEAIDAVCQERVGSLQSVGQVPALVAFVPLGVPLDVAHGRPEHVLVVSHHRAGICGLHSSSAGVAGVSVRQVRRLHSRSISMGRPFHKEGILIYTAVFNLCIDCIFNPCVACPGPSFVDIANTPRAPV
jgi:hypothetical protein